MNKYTKAAILSAAVALTGQAALAQVAGDLLLGFNEAGHSDFVLDLGQISALSANSVTHLGGGSTASFLVNFGGSTSGVAVAALGNVNPGTRNTIYFDNLRAGAINGPLTVGTETALNNPPAGNLTAAGNDIATIVSGVSTTFTPAVGNSPSDVGWAGTVDQLLGSPPGGLVDFSSGSVVLDIMQNKRTANLVDTGWNFAGALTVNLSGANSVIDFTPVGFTPAVPEPATYGIFAGAGLLALALRRQFGRANA